MKAEEREEKLNELNSLKSKGYFTSAEITESNICLKDIFDNGQCFRWEALSDDKSMYVGIFDSNVYVLEEVDLGNNNYKILIDTTNTENPVEALKYYLDLSKDYMSIYYEYLEIASKRNIPSVKKSIDYGHKMRILNQEKIETIISFIFSANNNIPRIKASIETLSNQYGDEIICGYHAFPTLDQLKNVSETDFKLMGAGYRAPNLVKTIEKLDDIDFDELEKLSDDNLMLELLKLNGVGPKVANCIMLFAFHRTESFPIDTWVKKVMYEEFFNGKEVSNAEIEKAVKDFPEKGLLQQLLFYWRRAN